MCIQVQQITYIHPDKEVLFRNLSFTVGVSVTISRVFFDFRYDMGLHNISKSVTYDIPADNNAADENTKNEIRFHRRDNVLSFSFGVFF